MEGSETNRDAHHRGNACASYVYAVGAHEDERELCRLELETLLGRAPSGGCVVSGRGVPPERSPFVRGRLETLGQSRDLGGLAGFAAGLELGGRTFKLVFMETDGSVPYGRRREIEREIGWHIRGKADMRAPAVTFGIAHAEGMWRLGYYEPGEAVWLRHNRKPQPYSTALGAKLARAIVNIAAPGGPGARLVDPCCGTGTVLIEAMSMGIDIDGCDINPQAVRGARINLAHFGMPEDAVRLADMRELGGRYDAAIVDLPYNLCSVMPEPVRLAMLRSVRRLAERAVIVSTEPLDEAAADAGLAIVDRCTARKGRFERQILLCRGAGSD